MCWSSARCPVAGASLAAGARLFSTACAMRAWRAELRLGRRRASTWTRDEMRGERFPGRTLRGAPSATKPAGGPRLRWPRSADQESSPRICVARSLLARAAAEPEKSARPCSPSRRRGEKPAPAASDAPGNGGSAAEPSTSPANSLAPALRPPLRDALTTDSWCLRRSAKLRLRAGVRASLRGRPQGRRFVASRLGQVAERACGRFVRREDGSQTVVSPALAGAPRSRCVNHVLAAPSERQP